MVMWRRSFQEESISRIWKLCYFRRKEQCFLLWLLISWSSTERCTISSFTSLQRWYPALISLLKLYFSNSTSPCKMTIQPCKDTSNDRRSWWLRLSPWMTFLLWEVSHMNPSIVLYLLRELWSGPRRFSLRWRLLTFGVLCASSRSMCICRMPE